MADRPSTLRQGRPKTRSVHQTPYELVVKPKVGRPRSVYASKITDASKVIKVKKTPGRPPKQVKVVPQPEQRGIQIDSHNLDIEFPFYPDRLPDLPPVEPNQPNFPTDQPQQNQETSLPPNQAEQPEPNQVPNQLLDSNQISHQIYL